MESEQAADMTSLSKHKKLMFVANKQRYVDVMQCSGDEMSVLLQQGLPVPVPAPAPTLVFSQGQGHVMQIQQPSTLQMLRNVQPPTAATYWTVQQTPHTALTVQQPYRTPLPLQATAQGLTAAGSFVRVVCWLRFFSFSFSRIKLFVAFRCQL
jgi:hypothetical protein